MRLLIGKKIVSYKKVYMIKYQVNRSLERYKVQLVAKGYIQTYELDYF